MKISKTKMFIAVILFITLQGNSQTINWASLKTNQKNIVGIHIGWDYGLGYGINYSHLLNYRIPSLLNVSYSFPSGENLLDDFKVKIGGQIRLYNMNRFQLSMSIHGIFRRFENPLVRLQNVGSEMTGIIGYYKKKWFLAGEIGFDKAIINHIKHSEKYKINIDTYALDAWYGPTAGGNINYGIQTGYSFKSSDLIFEIGKVITQDFKTTPLIPYYMQLGYNFKF